jgi:TorA maturation chaperone TorD
MDRRDLAASAARRSALYWMLSEILLTCPDERFIARLRQLIGAGAAPSSADAGEQAFAKMAAALPDASQAEDLAVEYTRLFGAVSPSYGPPPPYESAHLRSSGPGDIAGTIDGVYAGAGLAPQSEGVPPDHLGTQLKFLALLCHAEREAWTGGANARALQRQEYDFLSQHVMAWVPGYLEALRASTPHRFYEHLAALISAFLQEEERFLAVPPRLDATAQLRARGAAPAPRRGSGAPANTTGRASGSNGGALRSLRRIVQLMETPAARPTSIQSLFAAAM